MLGPTMLRPLSLHGPLEFYNMDAKNIYCECPVVLCPF